MEKTLKRLFATACHTYGFKCLCKGHLMILKRTSACMALMPLLSASWTLQWQPGTGVRSSRIKNIKRIEDVNVPTSCGVWPLGPTHPHRQCHSGWESRPPGQAQRFRISIRIGFLHQSQPRKKKCTAVAETRRDDSSPPLKVDHCGTLGKRIRAH